MLKTPGRVHIALALLLITAWVFLAVLYYQMVSAPLTTAIDVQQEGMLSGLVTELDQWLSSKVVELQTLGQLDSLSALDLEAALPQLRLLAQHDPDFDLLALVDLSGNGHPTTGGSFDISDRAYYQEVIAHRRPVLGDPVISLVTGHPIIPISVPLKAADGSLRAVLVGAVSLDGLGRLMADESMETGYPFLIQQEGLFVYHPDQTLVMSATVDVLAAGDVSAVRDISRMTSGNRGIVLIRQQKQHLRLSYAPLTITHWYVGLMIDENGLLAPLTALRRLMLVSTFLISLLIAGGGLFLAYRTRYQVQLLDMAKASTHLTNLFRDMRTGVITTDARGVISMLNPPAELLTGWAEQDAKGRPVTSILQIAGANELLGRLITACLAGQKPDVIEQKLVGRSGSQRQVVIEASPVYGLSYEVTGVVLLLSDITSLRVYEAKLGYYDLLAGRTRDIVLVMDLDGLILEANTAALSSYGYARTDLVGKNVQLLRAPETSPPVEVILQRAAQEGVVFETWHMRSDGTLFPVEVSLQSANVGDSQLLVSIVHDVSERHQSQERIRYLSYHDRLTGLFNRVYFDEATARLDQHSLPVTLVLGDVNGLKLANDAFGHSVGDQLLRQIATIIVDAAEGNMVFRWGGDEFVILMPEADEKTAEQICERIWEKCSQAEVDSVAPSLALGVATKHTEQQSLADVWRQAEDRMYRNKLSQGTGLRSSLVSSLRATLAERSHETEAHCLRMRILGLELGRAAQLPESELDELQLLALLHDLGKVAIPDHILLKPSPLTPPEWDIMRQHPEIGYRIAQATPEMTPIAQAILAHHERWDGRGYPLGLAGEQIPRLSRLIAILDAFDVMTHDRPYRKAMPVALALQETAAGAGSQFDPELAKLFLELSNAIDWDQLPAEGDEGSNGRRNVP